MFVAENSGIVTEDLEKLFYNGFDDPDSFALVKDSDLKQLGVQEDPTLVFDKIQATMEVWREHVASGAAWNNQQILEESQEQDQTVDHSQSMLPQIKLPADARILNRDILLGKMLSKPKQIGW